MSATNTLTGKTRFPADTYTPVHSVPGLFVHTACFVEDVVALLAEGPEGKATEHFNATLERAKALLHPEALARGAEILLCVAARNRDGWLEFTLCAYNSAEATRPFVVGCIQRRPGAESEFHS